mmetsp:Transcript_2712/g.7659  ORF Transcript_2712/g.7659 Transcript_2712/m.7659 type:complete len:81 (-) Transcript_2712:145-387(-)
MVCSQQVKQQLRHTWCQQFHPATLCSAFHTKDAWKATRCWKDHPAGSGEPNQSAFKWLTSDLQENVQFPNLSQIAADTSG